MSGETTQAAKTAPGRTRSTQAHQLLALVTVAFVAAGLFGAPGLRTWSEDLPDGLVAGAIRDGVEVWASATERAGLDRPYLALKLARTWLEALRFNRDDE